MSPTQRTERYEFASDNTAGMMPELLAELSSINSGATAGYGRDEYTARAKKLISDFFERDCDVAKGEGSRKAAPLWLGRGGTGL